MLQGHPDMKGTPGIDMSSGSLGQGVSAACGMALAAKLDNKDYRVYTLLGDGECEEGQVWEAAMFAAHKNWITFALLLIATVCKLMVLLLKLEVLNHLTKSSPPSVLMLLKSMVTILTKL